MRPHGTYPTIEFRVTDVCPSVDDAVAIAAFARALTVAVAEGVLSDEAEKRMTSGLEQEVLRVNEWRAAHEGLGACYVNALHSNTLEPMRDAIRRLLDVVADTAARLGDRDELAHVSTILSRGTASDRMRTLFAQRQSLIDLTDWLQAETLVGVGMDHRHTQRTVQAV
jgi:carboxylate-amine ligase